MEIGKIKLKINRDTIITKVGVTPAEVLVFQMAHEVGAGGNPIVETTIVGDAPRSNINEYSRLNNLYPNLKIRPQGAREDEPVVHIIFGKAAQAARLPQKFSDIGIKAERKAHKRVNYTPEPQGNELLMTDAGFIPVVDQGDGNEPEKSTEGLPGDVIPVADVPEAAPVVHSEAKDVQPPSETEASLIV